MEIESRSAYLKIENGKVTKTFKEPMDHLNEEWFYFYNLFRQQYNNCVNVYEFSNEHIVMDYVEGELLDVKMLYRDHRFDTFDAYHGLHANIFKMMSSFYEFSFNNKIGWWHDDANDPNIIVADDFSLTLIDPDAFVLDKFVDLSPAELPSFNTFAMKHGKFIRRKGII